MRQISRQPRDEERGGELREQAARRLVADLIARRARGRLGAGDVRAAAAKVGVSDRTLSRWMAAGGPLVRGRPSPRRLVLTDALRDAYLRLGGNAAAVWRDARERGLEPPPLR